MVKDIVSIPTTLIGPEAGFSSPDRIGSVRINSVQVRFSSVRFFDIFLIGYFLGIFLVFSYLGYHK